MGRRNRESRQLGFGYSEPVSGDSTLREARRLLRARLVAGGGECPCCRQLAKVYKRKLSSSMGYALVLIYRYFEVYTDEAWLHVPTYLNGFGVVARGGDWSKLVFWGMIEERPEDREDGCKHAGHWRITEKGKRFVRKVETAPKHLFFYNGQCVALSAEQTFIDEALGNHFHYDELMRG